MSTPTMPDTEATDDWAHQPFTYQAKGGYQSIDLSATIATGKGVLALANSRAEPELDSSSTVAELFHALRCDLFPGAGPYIRDLDRDASSGTDWIYIGPTLGKLGNLNQSQDVEVGTFGPIQRNLLESRLVYRATFTEPLRAEIDRFRLRISAEQAGTFGPLERDSEFVRRGDWLAHTFWANTFSVGNRSFVRRSEAHTAIVRVSIRIPGNESSALRQGLDVNWCTRIQDLA